MSALPEPSELWIALMIGMLLLVGAIAVLASAIGRWMTEPPRPPSAEEQAADERGVDSVRARLSEQQRTGTSDTAVGWWP